MSKSKWSRDQLEEAVKMVKSKKMSQNRAANVYGIPVSTLHSHVRHIPGKVGAGRPTVLTYEEEREICPVPPTQIHLSMYYHLAILQLTIFWLPDTQFILKNLILAIVSRHFAVM